MNPINTLKKPIDIKSKTTLCIDIILCKDFYVEIIDQWLKTYAKTKHVDVKINKNNHAIDSYIYTIECDGTPANIREYRSCIAGLVANYSRVFTFTEI